MIWCLKQTQPMEEQTESEQEKKLIFLWGLMVYVAGGVGEQSSSVCGEDRLWELKAAFLFHHSLGNLSQNLNTD